MSASPVINSSQACARCAAAALLRPARRGSFLARAATAAGRFPHHDRRRSRPYSSSSSSATTGESGPSSKPKPKTAAAPDQEAKHQADEEQGQAGGDGGGGAMSRRLAEATEDALLTGGRAGRRAVEDAGFSDELKARLLAKVQDAQFRSEHASAFAEAGLSGGRATSASTSAAAGAAGAAWTGEETTEDAVRRMLNDAHKPLRGGGRGGKPRLPDLQPVDLRLSRAPRRSPGERAATAKEKAGAYAGMGVKEKSNSAGGAGGSAQNGLSDEEREAFRREMQERFRPAGRTMPATLTGLASLANERIEDAIARGQFRNIPRGRAVERDARADNPFVDTTEYLMNKMIQRQDLVPPWIEKQQELQKAARVFRARLRADWKRHVARMLAADGGPLETQLRRARRLADAEALHNPSGRPAAAPAKPEGGEAVAGLGEAERRVLAEWAAEEEKEHAVEGDGSGSSASADAEATSAATTSAPSEPRTAPAPEPPLPRPFRDPDWLAAEKSYMEAAVGHLNALTRSYNLMAPELAKKPYYSLERELRACYADVAPHVAGAIRDRAARPARSSLAGDYVPRSGILDRFGGGERGAKVYDSRAPHYGFREMWRDVFGGGKTD